MTPQAGCLMAAANIILKNGRRYPQKYLEKGKKDPEAQLDSLVKTEDTTEYSNTEKGMMQRTFFLARSQSIHTSTQNSLPSDSSPCDTL